MDTCKNGFFAGQVGYLLRSWHGRKGIWHRVYFGLELVQLPLDHLRLRHTLGRPAANLELPSQDCVVILLSHNRPQNLRILVEGALRNGFVREVIVSNSNPGVRIGEWIPMRDSRLTLIDERNKTLPGHRFVLAAAAKGHNFLSVDDDIFLTPSQWAEFFAALVQSPQVPHGISGQIYRPGTVFTNDSPFHHRENLDEEVDVLIGAYAFTRTHLEQVFRLTEELKLGSVSQIGNGEDILLSFAGTDRPRIHNLGRVLLCKSTSLPGVALWTTRTNFWQERCSLFEKVKAARLSGSQFGQQASGKSPAFSALP